MTPPWSDFSGKVIVMAINAVSGILDLSVVCIMILE